MTVEPTPQDLRELLEQGATFAELATRFHLSGEELWKRLRGLKLKTAKPAKRKPLKGQPFTTSEEERQVAEAFKRGKFVSEVARQFSISHQTVYRILREHQVRLRRIPPPAWRARALAENGLSVEEIVLLLKAEYGRRFTDWTIRHWLDDKDGYVARG